MSLSRVLNLNSANKVLISSFLFVGLLVSIMIFSPTKAHATLSLNPDPGTAIPAWVYNYSSNCDTSTQSPSFDDWISGTGSLTQTSVDVDYGTTSIGLVYAMASVVCLPNSAVTENNQLFTGASPGVNNIVGKQYRIDYTSAGGPGGYKTPGTYRGAIVGFDYAPAGGFTSSGLYTVTLYSVAINDFDSGGFLCIGARKAGMGNPTNARDYDKCEPEPTDFSIWVNVKGGPPGGQTFVTCDGGFRGIAYDGDDLNASLAVAIIIDSGKSSQRIINLTANEDIPTPEFNLTALAAFGVSGKKGFTEAIPPEYKDGYAHTYQVIAGNIPKGQLPEISPIGDGNIVCPISFKIIPTGQAAFDDDESPKYVDFSNVGAASNKTVKQVTVTRKYVIVRAGTSIDEPLNPDPIPSSSVETITPPPGFNFSPDPDQRDVSSKNLQIGDQACVIVTATPGSGEINNGGVIKVPVGVATGRFCVPVVSKPYVSFYGNDILVGRDFADINNGTCSDVAAPGGTVLAYNKKLNDGTNRYIGSSSQLAINALRIIDGISSESVRADINPKKLSFANNQPAVTFGGNFGTSNRCIRNYFVGADEPAVANPATNEINSRSIGNSWSQFYTSNLTINRPTSIPKGARWTIYVKGDVLIKRNITYDTSGWASKDDIPAFYLIVEGNISIDSSVTQLDGVYVAQPKDATTGIINTCTKPDGSSFALNDSSEMYDNCQNPLSIYGSFSAKKVLLNRVASSVRNAGPNEPWNSSNAAEKFIFSPEALLVEPNIPPESSEIGGLDYMTTLQPIL